VIAKKSAVLLPLTKELAAKIANLPGLPGERPVKPERIAFHLARLRERAFLSPNWAIGIAKDTGLEYRANGQHTSKIISELSLDDMELVPDNVTLDTYEMDSVNEDGAALFEIFDHPITMRSNEDAIGVALSGHLDMNGRDRKFMVAVGRAINFYRNDIRRREPDKAKGMRLYGIRETGNYFHEFENRRFALWIEQWVGSQNAWMIRVPAVTAEIFADWKAAEEMATMFWNYVFTETHPDSDDETRDLARRLNELHHKKHVKPDVYRNPIKRLWVRFVRAQEVEERVNRARRSA
jgi:hypothetical protein